MGFFLTLILSSSGERMDARFLGRSSSLSRFTSDVDVAATEAAAAAAAAAAAKRKSVINLEDKRRDEKI